MILSATYTSDIKVATGWSSFFLCPPLTFSPGLQLFLIFCFFLVISLFHHQNCCFQLLLVTATVLLHSSHSLDPSLPFPLSSVTFFLILVNSYMLPKIYLNYSTNHRGIVPLFNSLLLLGVVRLALLKEVCECFCAHTCVCVSVCNYF